MSALRSKFKPVDIDEWGCLPNTSQWQRKLGAPKTEGSFDELFNCVCTMERREQQYNDIADGKDKPRKVDKRGNK